MSGRLATVEGQAMLDWDKVYLTWQVCPKPLRAVGGVLYLIIHSPAAGAEWCIGPRIKKGHSGFSPAHLGEGRPGFRTSSSKPGNLDTRKSDKTVRKVKTILTRNLSQTPAVILDPGLTATSFRDLGEVTQPGYAFNSSMTGMPSYRAAHRELRKLRNWTSGVKSLWTKSALSSLQ